MTQQLHILLHQLGINATYLGFRQSIYAVSLVTEDTTRLLQITKQVYCEVGKAFHTSFQCVERNIKTVALVAWRRNRSRLEGLAGYPLPEPPTPSQFIDILASQFTDDKNGPNLC